MVKGCLCRIQDAYPAMSRKEKALANHVLQHQDVIYKSITDLVTSSKIGYGTISRFCVRLGYAGFQDFKIHLAEDLGSNRHNTHDRKSDPVMHIAKRACSDIDNTAHALSRSNLEACALRIANASFVFLAGCAGASVSAHELEYRLTRIGINAACVDDHHMQTMKTAMLRKTDVLFLVSFTGSTNHVLRLGQMARGRGVFTACLTNHSRSPLTEIVDCVLCTSTCVTPLDSEIVSKITSDFVQDVLVDYIMRRKRDSRQMLRRTYESVANTQL